MKDKINLKNYPNKFNLNKAPNLAVRLSKGEFVVQATSDQILSRAGWFNLLNFIENVVIYRLVAVITKH